MPFPSQSFRPATLRPALLPCRFGFPAFRLTRTFAPTKMNTNFLSIGGALVLAFFVTGCASDNTSARIQEKSAAYATLKLSEKRFIEKGVVATGFTPDMVYMAVGSPSKVEPVKTADGGVGELWTYSNYYPSYDAAYMRYAPYTTEMVYQPTKTEPRIGDYDGDIEYLEPQIPAGMSKNGPSLATTGRPQGGSMEPADLKSFTLQVLFQAGKVARLGMKPT